MWILSNSNLPIFHSVDTYFNKKIPFGTCHFPNLRSCKHNFFVLHLFFPVGGSAIFIVTDLFYLSRKSINFWWVSLLVVSITSETAKSFLDNFVLENNSLTTLKPKPGAMLCNKFSLKRDKLILNFLTHITSLQFRLWKYRSF